MSKKLYFCNCCRVKVPKIESLLFVEESKRGFCSENCIVKFFTPYMEAFDAEEVLLREGLGILPDEVEPDIFHDKVLFEEALYGSSEVWSEKNDLGEEFFTHIHPLEGGLFYILICSYYEGEPAFVFFKTLTASIDLVGAYKRGSKYDNDALIDVSDDEDLELETTDGKLEDISLPAEIIEDMDLKKSEYLADLLDRRKETDISFEKFPMYDDYITLTLDEPDSEFQITDDAGDRIYTFIKSFQKNGEAFFYIVICLSVEIPGSKDRALMPVVTFPSIDDELYKFYAVGDKKNRRITN